MVFSLSDFDNLQFSSNLGNTSPVFPTDSGESQSNLPSPTEATGEPATAQDSSSLAVPALDPALVPCSPLAPNQTTNPMLHSEDLTQLAHHLALQKSLSKPNANELMSFSKIPTQQPLGEQLVWIAAAQLSLNESVLAIFSGEVSPTLMKHIKQEVGKRVLLPNLPAYKNKQISFDLVKDTLLVDQNSNVSEETLNDVDFCKKLKSAILTSWTKARSAVKTEVAQSLGEDPVTELNTEGLPNRRPSSTDITQLSMKILQSVPGTKGIKFSVAFVARAAFLWYCYTISQSTGGDYWGLVDEKLEEIRETVKDPATISQKFTKILSVDQHIYGSVDKANRPLADKMPPGRRSSGSIAITGGKRKRP